MATCRRHGLTRYIHDNCRCVTCEDGYLFARRVVLSLMDDTDETINEIAAETGYTTQFCYMQAAKLSPSRPWQTRRRMAQIEAEAHGMNEKFKYCQVCGVGHFKTAYCSTRCRNVQLIYLRRATATEEYRASHQRSVAKWYLAHPDEANEYQIRHAHRVLDGESGYHGRWLTVGSLSWKWAVYAYQEGWPIADRLHPEIRAQVAERFESPHRERVPEPA